MFTPLLQAYFNEVNKRRAEVNKEVSEKFNLSKGGKQDPAIKWMELRKQGKIKDREKYEQYGETNRGIVIPQVRFAALYARLGWGVCFCSNGSLFTSSHPPRTLFDLPAGAVWDGEIRPGRTVRAKTHPVVGFLGWLLIHSRTLSRFDLRLPYVDEGYVDESASLGNTLKRLFGFGKESKPTTLPKGPGSDGPGATKGGKGGKK